MFDDLTLFVGGRALSGWTDIRVTRGIERLPSDFEIGMTELYPHEASVYTVQPGDECVVKIGNDTVISGYVDRFIPTISGAQHAIRITGRSKCADLVDCAAEWPGGQISGSSVLEIAQILVRPYSHDFGGIQVIAPGDEGVRVPQFNLNLGSTPFEIIEQLCRYSGLLAYDDPDGNLILSQVSEAMAGSGFTEGQNVESATITYASDQCFSEYVAFIQSMDRALDLGDSGNLIATEYDPNVRRHRRRVIIAEAGDSNFDVAKKRAKWEAVRRFGRSRQLRLTTDSWRDRNGVLWMPNTLVPLSLPTLKIDQAMWTISEVSYVRNEHDGTVAQLVIMPPEAFIPQPVVFQPAPADVPANPGKGAV